MASGKTLVYGLTGLRAAILRQYVSHSDAKDAFRTPQLLHCEAAAEADVPHGRAGKHCDEQKVEVRHAAELLEKPLNVKSASFMTECGPCSSQIGNPPAERKFPPLAGT